MAARQAARAARRALQGREREQRLPRGRAAAHLRLVRALDRGEARLRRVHGDRAGARERREAPGQLQLALQEPDAAGPLRHGARARGAHPPHHRHPRRQRAAHRRGRLGPPVARQARRGDARLPHLPDRDHQIVRQRGVARRRQEDDAARGQGGRVGGVRLLRHAAQARVVPRGHQQPAQQRRDPKPLPRRRDGDNPRRPAPAVQGAGPHLRHGHLRLLRRARQVQPAHCALHEPGR
mmetsp:Transcript_14336/g.33394  ORF Transcript_14336/g.33394 Transcript_14336/m.33394 type:complete len:237 (+) Transcript_14336:1593-2303(+)